MTADPVEQGLLEAIAIDFTAIEPRLIYGDWLQARDDPRGELFVIQHARLSRPDDVELRQREAELIKTLTEHEIATLKDSGVIDGGMIPKVDCALDALGDGVNKAHIIDGRVEHALLLEVLTNEGVGTMIRSDVDDPREVRARGPTLPAPAHGD